MRASLRFSFFLLPLVAACAASSPSPDPSPPVVGANDKTVPADLLAGKHVARSVKATALRQPWMDAAARAAAAHADPQPPMVENARNVPYPAFKPNAAQVITKGGTTLKQPKV